MEARGCHFHTLPLLRPRSLLTLKQTHTQTKKKQKPKTKQQWSFYIHLVSQLLWLLPEDDTPESLVASRAYVHRFNGTVGNNDIVLNSTSLHSSVQRRQKHSSPGFHWKRYIGVFCLKVQLPISLQVGVDRDSPLWDTDRSCHTLNYWELLRTKMSLTHLWSSKQPTKSSGRVK